MKNENIINNKSFNVESAATMGSRTVAVYTVLLVLKKMKDRLGIEAMVEFVERYASTIEQLNPEIKQAVNYQLLERALYKLYGSVCPYEE